MYLEGKHILVIDNEAERREQSQRILAAEGFAVTVAAEGLSAIRAAASGRFALAVIATQLPGSLDGVATLRQLRARQPWLKALFAGEPAARPAGSDRERDDFIPAPFARRELIGCVLELLERDSWQRRAASGECGRAG